MTLPDESNRCPQCAAIPAPFRPGVDDCVHCRWLRDGGHSATLKATQYDLHPCVKKIKWEAEKLLIIYIHEFAKSEEAIKECIHCKEIFLFQTTLPEGKKPN